MRRTFSALFLLTAALGLASGAPAFACQKPVESVHWLIRESNSYQEDYCSAVLNGFSPVRCLRTPDERAADLNFCRNQTGDPIGSPGIR
jgi:hypothetical protein